MFSRLPEDITVRYFNQCVTRRYGKKEEVFVQDERVEYIYLVISGQIRVYLSYPNGKEFTLVLLGDGDVYSGHTRASAQALTESEVCLIPVEVFRKLLAEVPAFAANVIAVLGDALKNSMNIIESLVFKEANKRLYEFLYCRIQQAALPDGESARIKLGLNHQQIGTMVGSTRQTVNAFLNNLQKEGVISVNKDTITVNNLNLIAARARDGDETDV